MRPADVRGRGFASPEDAAMEGFPPKHCRVVAARIEGDEAYVLLNTGSDRPYLYGCNCFRREGRWFESGSGNAPSWHASVDDPDVGVLSLWDDAPPGADRVRAEYRGTVFEAPVTDGVYLFAWFRQPQIHGAPSEWPREIAFRVAGEWVRSPDSGS